MTISIVWVIITIMSAFWAGEHKAEGNKLEAVGLLLCSIVSILILIGDVAAKAVGV